jgi:hypothetical protein
VTNLPNARAGAAPAYTGPTGDLRTSVSITGTAIVPHAKCATLTLTSANGHQLAASGLLVTPR